jgi:hypothetical protein
MAGVSLELMHRAMVRRTRRYRDDRGATIT